RFTLHLHALFCEGANYSKVLIELPRFIFAGTAFAYKPYSNGLAPSFCSHSAQVLHYGTPLQGKQSR
ncbi:MAG: hypothetical protein V4641_00200, partial [Pseudomonadota bacterium]